MPSAPAPYYQDESVTIYCGDVCEIAHFIRGDAVITDPPYEETRFSWDKWPPGWPEKVKKVASSFWCFGSLRLFMRKQREFRGWKIAQDAIWEKHNGSSLLNDRFRRTHETIVQFYRGRWSEVYHQPVYTYDSSPRKIYRQNDPKHWGREAAGMMYERARGGPRLLRSVIFARTTHHQQAEDSDNEKPEAIVRPLIEYSIPPGGVLVDCFCGSGALLSAAKSLGRRAIGIDVRESACESAVRRVSQAHFPMLDVVRPPEDRDVMLQVPREQEGELFSEFAA